MIYCSYYEFTLYEFTLTAIDKNHHFLAVQFCVTCFHKATVWVNFIKELNDLLNFTNISGNQKTAQLFKLINITDLHSSDANVVIHITEQ